MKYIILLFLLASIFYTPQAEAVTGTCTAPVVDPLVPRVNPTSISWCNPVENMDGSQFDPTVEQTTATIYCGIAIGTYTKSTTLSAGIFPAVRQTTQLFDPVKTALGLTNGVWYCVATVTGSTANESPYSDPVAIQIDSTATTPNPPVLAMF